ncbi:KINESIN-RELATED [Salix purpurea]|uniref:KINESIN-RELATED n=1 Tax=Salix purpurea TaxID=77065 RepID=A0A9Q0VRU0_SALPP|nr:KINESIN-RELATED [Salix purpurea]
MQTGDDNSKIALSTGELSMFDEGKKIGKESSSSMCNECGLPPLSAQLQEIVNKMRSICSSIPSCMDTTPHNDGFHTATSTDIVELTTHSSMRTDDDNNKIALSTRELPMFDEGKKIGKESSCSICNLDRSALHIKELEEIVNNMKSIGSSTSSCIDIPPHDDALHAQASTDIGEPATLSMRTDDDNNKIALSTRELPMFDEGKKIGKESSCSICNLDRSALHIKELEEIVNNMKSIGSSTSSCIDIPPHDDALHAQASTDIGEPTTLSMGVSNRDITSFSTWEKFTAGSTGMKNSLAQDYLRLLNTADKEVLQKLKGIGEKRATYILELREDNPEPFKNLDDLKVIGLSAKQVRRWL